MELLQLAFSLDIGNPNSMPVTRDLSPRKRKAILEWLRTPGPDGKPLLGMLQAPLPSAEPPMPEATLTPATANGPVIPRGGKAAAMGRRLILQHKPA